MGNNKGYLSLPEIAKICNVNRSTVWRWVQSDKLKASKTPGGYFKIMEKEFLLFQKKYPTLTNQKKKILVVDDDQQFQNTIKRMLETEAFEIEYATDGFEAGIKTLDFDPDLIILDLYLPKLNGFEVCKQLRKTQRTKDIKIIAISGYGVEDNMARVLEAGADVFIPKPFDQKTLIENIQATLKIEIINNK